MAKKTTVSTAEDKLRALYDLQLIDSRIDRIRVVRGELPLEVEDLEDEIAGLRTRLERLEEEVDLVNQRIAAYKNQIEESKALITKYTEQQNNVRNNREFDSLNKEIEYQTLEIELCEKKIRECLAQVDQKSELVVSSKEKVEMRDADLVGKRSELAEIISETQAEESVLTALERQDVFEHRSPLVGELPAYSQFCEKTDWPWFQSNVKRLRVRISRFHHNVRLTSHSASALSSMSTADESWLTKSWPTRSRFGSILRLQRRSQKRKNNKASFL